MTVFLILFSIFIFSLIMFVHTTKKKYKIKKKQNRLNTKSNNLNVYQLYSNWCKNNNLTPVSEEEFNGLADGKGNINITDVIALHPEFRLENKISDDYETKKLKEEDERKKRDQDFANSAIIGYMTDSTTTGTLFGGSLLGGLLGSHLSKKKKK